MLPRIADIPPATLPFKPTDKEPGHIVIGRQTYREEDWPTRTIVDASERLPRDASSVDLPPEQTLLDRFEAFVLTDAGRIVFWGCVAIGTLSCWGVLFL